MSQLPNDHQPMTTQVVEALRRIIRAIEIHSRALVHTHGLTGPQLVVLKWVGEHSEASAGEVARAVHLSQATITGIIDRLEARGMVQRSRSSLDKRRVHVRLTPAGEELLLRTPPLLQEHFTSSFIRLPQWQQTQILASLQCIVSLMEAQDLRAASILTTGPIDATAETTKEFLDDR